jgi:hypothetical protein
MTARTLLLATALLVSAACLTAPDQNSGGDQERHKAKPLAVGKFDADAIDYRGGDRTDWKFIMLDDSGFLTIELVLDNPASNVKVELFDRYGKPVAQATHKKDDSNPQIKLTSEVGLGKYFVMVQAASESSKTGYSIKASVK